MNKLYLRLQSASVVTLPSGNKVILTARKFLGLDGSEGYFSPSQLLTYAQSLREIEVDQIEQVFTCMKNGLRMAGAIVTRPDKAGRPYSYLSFIKLNATVGLKLILEHGMKQFVLDYQDNKFAVGFSFEELIEEALNA
ncbi:hypothetical protein HDF18_22640 [Mucilaginibacter sp. X5P1]|uniref:hypothetical protein n=1 Tax=Mucilaginibacter sp. X5P1 TaxID=2723088 RepID=UPI0016077857|nr:hypothetical protein [Mucilaginibacter sp. X5P1]MBB6141081.1 hypothetical protein [Mucilaginibacter sp. X5P1]